MKEIPNKQFSDKETVATLLAICLNSVPHGGLDFATIRARSKVADVIEKVESGGTIKLEDRDHETAKQAISTARWTSWNKNVIELGELFGL